ncbi:MAG: hypothetical protein IPO68_16790, partial [Chitinophagaceae bacterium]|nr:hypothetical protein [Chitinophagaceae bacterium]
EQNCWISVTTTDADEVKQAVEAKIEAEKPAEEKGVIEKLGDLIKGEPVALSAEKIEAVDVLQKTPKDSTAFFRRPTLKGDERQLVSVYTDTVEEAQKVTAGYTKAELLGCWDWWTGEITSPLAANLVDYMPDVVTYDENGQEISRERPTEPGQTLIIFGQGERKWE